jgi:hypothetical protein
VGGLWRHRCCGGHRLIAEGQPHAKRLRERKDTQQHRRIPISYPRSGTRTIDRNLDRNKERVADLPGVVARWLDAKCRAHRPP